MRTEHLNLKRKILICILMFCMFITYMPAISFADIIDTTSEDVKIEQLETEIANKELKGKEPCAETEDTKETNTSDELALNPIYILNHLDKSLINVDEVHLSSFYEVVTAAKGVATYNINKQRKFEVTEDNYIAGMQYQIPVYDIDEKSDYYVCIPDINMTVNNYKPYDLMVAYNNDNAELIEDYKYTDGILYIPKTVIDNPTNICPLSDELSIIAIQLNYAIGNDGKFTKSIPVNINDGDSEEPTNKVVIAPNIFDRERLSVETDVKHREASSCSVYLNGHLIPINDESFEYNPDTGELFLSVMPGVISNINIAFEHDPGMIERIKKSLSDDAGKEEETIIQKEEKVESVTDNATSENAEEKESESVLDIIKDEVGDFFSNVLTDITTPAYAVTPTNMDVFCNSSGTKTKLTISKKDIFVGWRGYYTPQKDGSHEAQYHGSSDYNDRLNAPGWKNSIKYMYSGYTTMTGDGGSFSDKKFDYKMINTWAIMSYAQGVDLGKSSRNTVLTADKNVKHPTGENSTKSMTIWEWFKDKRANLEKNNGKIEPFSANGLGGSTNFAIKFPSNGKINGCEDSLISSGANKGRANNTIEWKSETTPNTINGEKNYYYAASCNHLETAAGSEGGYSKVYVACVGRGDDWVALAFVMNRKGQEQDACGIYKFQLSPPPDIFGSIRIQKSLTGPAAEEGSLEGFSFYAIDASGNTYYAAEPSDYDGEAYFRNLPPHTYTIYEVVPSNKLAEGYSDVTYSYTVVLTGGESSIVTVPWVNKYDPNLKIEATEAYSNDTGINVSYINSTVHITDIIYYYDATPGRTYTVAGSLVNKDTGSTITTTTDSFTASALTGSTEVSFTMDASDYLNKSVVCYESVYYNGMFQDSLIDLYDDWETIHYPKITTTALADSTGKHITKSASDQAITDTIHYSNFSTGYTYKTRGTCIDKTTGEILAVVESAFYADTQSGDLPVHFNIDARNRKNHTLAFKEEVFYNNILVAKHDDLDDEEQCIHIPLIKTYCTDDETSDKFAMPGENHNVTDRVYYYNLLPGFEYSLDGEYLHKLNMSCDATGNTTFTPTSADGVIDVKFHLDALKIPYTYVAYEDLLIDGVSVAEHKLRDSESQTVRMAKITTRALDTKTQDHIMLGDANASIVDTVSYKNLLIGRKYDVKSYVYDKETNQSVKITQERNFTPIDYDGAFNVRIPGDYSKLQGKTLVVMQDVVLHDNYAAIHWDINSEPQTIHIPKIDTKLEEIGEPGEASLRDTVNYWNLIPNRRYLIVGSLIDNKTGQKVAEVKNTFIPSSADGIYNVYFKDKNLQGKTVTAFERIYYDCTDMEIPANLVAKHEDVNDKDQTVKVIALGTITIDDQDKFFSKFFKDVGMVLTGDNNKLILLFAIIIIASIGLIISKKRRNK